jgi:hypothetical protein
VDNPLVHLVLDASVAPLLKPASSSEVRSSTGAAAAVEHSSRQEPWHPLLLISGCPHLLPQIPVPQNRMTPLKTAWLQLYAPITDNLKLDMRMNLKTKKVSSNCCLVPLQTTA